MSELREKIAVAILDCWADSAPVEQAADAILALIQKEQDARISELEVLVRFLLDRDPYEKITDPDAGQWSLIDEWRFRARRALGGDHG